MAIPATAIAPEPQPQPPFERLQMLYQQFEGDEEAVIQRLSLSSEEAHLLACLFSQARKHLNTWHAAGGIDPDDATQQRQWLIYETIKPFYELLLLHAQITIGQFCELQGLKRPVFDEQAYAPDVVDHMPLLSVPQALLHDHGQRY